MTSSGKPDRAARKLAFSGYHNRPAEGADTFLTAVGPGTPCGEYMRRFWHPFMLASELDDLPVPVRLLGEDLVVFRDRSGRLGLLHRYCIHRGVSLEFGIIAEQGIRCCYHGWHFDIDGTVLETPAEPSTSRIRHDFCQGAYRVVERHGLLFAYMGPPGETPEFPLYDTFAFEDDKLAPFKMNVPCNWLQITENACDPIHNAFLHAIVSGQQFAPAFKVMPALDFLRTPQGFLSMATRKVGEFVFLRAGEIIFPNVAQFPTGTNPVREESVLGHPTLTRWAVPLDDYHSLYIGAVHINPYSRARSERLEDYGVDKLPFIGQTADRPYHERQLEPGDYDAMVSPGPIVNRSNEHLGTADRGVVQFRRMLAAAIKAVQAGQAPELPRLPEHGRPVVTYAHETVLRLPHGNALADQKAVAEFGARAAQVFIDLDMRASVERNARAADKIRNALDEFCMREAASQAGQEAAT
ncbi:Phenoxybenzoate dioxygenase subunit alpha [Pigmentiphaga humi]|uniref:Phenoxybenzoate dioxygenase subunit alpha n=1 Tax=Pigmentiphaga humi TaxID=2478468 RepID=A0A3P4B424_9BURK|nr:aromatic ring-hydroxylating dioxygenase subunit alpha [Pigmentiphaga humi]VCU71047.1 Phenoxybenzoate dioxygenase subunit alpha [Pigmentiphaga humi]